MGTTKTDDPPLTTPAALFSLVGGKGGVGKTTCAAAMAVAAAASGARTLVITTDPAPSLGDAFGQRIGASPVRIPLRRGSLHAVEINAARALEHWLGRRRPALERIAVRGTWLDEEDVARLLRLSLPGIDEIAALLECVRLDQSGRFDRIIVDTAPTGHTLRMLKLPHLLRRVAHLFDSMQEKHRMMVATLRGSWRPDAEDALIEELNRDGEALAALLRDSARMETSWITLPEPMAIEETADGIAALAADGIRVRRLIVNRVTERPPTPCRHCDARRAFEQQALASLPAAAPGAVVIGIGTRQREPRGAAALAAIGRALEARGRRGHSPASLMPGSIVPAKRFRAKRPVAQAFRAGPRAGAPWGFREAVDDETCLLMFGGKGGVGKTTCAAAAALELSAAARTRRVLLLSTDPAHSLADVLGVRLSDLPCTVPRAPANLRVRELDAARRFAGIRKKYAAATAALFERISQESAIDASYDRAVMRDMIDLAPPGIDELVAVSDVTDALTGPGGSERFDLMVMDMAPSGHALRLLETPLVVQDWAKALMSILLKYQPVLGIGELGAILLKLSQEIGRLRALLRDSRRTRFIAVTRAAELPRRETVRLVRRLGRMQVRVTAVVVNATGRGTCSRCRREAAAESREIAALRAAPPIRKVRLLIAPAEIPPPHGAPGLMAWARQIREITAESKRPSRSRRKKQPDQ